MKYPVKAIFGGLMGNIVEAYDSAICYYLATELNLYLMGNDGSKPTTILFIVFLGYLDKPLGAFLLGLFSDVYGRKNVLAASILIMGGSDHSDRLYSRLCLYWIGFSRSAADFSYDSEYGNGIGIFEFGFFSGGKW